MNILWIPISILWLTGSLLGYADLKKAIKQKGKGKIIIGVIKVIAGPINLLFVALDETNKSRYQS